MASTQTDVTEENRTVLISGESEQISRISEFLTYSGIEAKNTFNEEADIFQLSVPDSQYEKASALLNIYLEQENDIASEDTEEKRSAPVSHAFIGSEQKYKDNSSSAFAFLSVGILVILVLVLSALNTLPFPLTWKEQPVMFLALCIVSAVFLIIGALSFKKAGTYKIQMDEENTLENCVVKWFTGTYTGAQLDQTIEAEEGSLPKAEILCLKRFELIHNYLMREYPSLEENHADSLSEIIYQKLYETES